VTSLLPEVDVALDLLSLGPSGGRILAGRKASGGAGLDGTVPLAFLWANIELLGMRGSPGWGFGLTLRPVSFALASSTGSNLTRL
jgi:hypothetical protein